MSIGRWKRVSLYRRQVLLCKDILKLSIGGDRQTKLFNWVDPAQSFDLVLSSLLTPFHLHLLLTVNNQACVF